MDWLMGHVVCRAIGCRSVFSQFSTVPYEHVCHRYWQRRFETNAPLRAWARRRR